MPYRTAPSTKHSYRPKKESKRAPADGAKSPSVGRKRQCEAAAPVLEWLATPLTECENREMPGTYFYGFKVSDAVKDKLSAVADKYRHLVPRATWPTTDKAHVTLKFIGKNQPTFDALKSICEETPPFKIEFKGVGTFCNKAGPRVLYATPRNIYRDALAELHQKFGGHAPSFTPHLTIAKLEDGGDAAPEFSQLQRDLHDFDFGFSYLDELGLYCTQGNGQPYKLVAWHRLIG